MWGDVGPRLHWPVPQGAGPGDCDLAPCWVFPCQHPMPPMRTLRDRWYSLAH